MHWKGCFLRLPFSWYDNCSWVLISELRNEMRSAAGAGACSSDFVSGACFHFPALAVLYRSGERECSQRPRDPEEMEMPYVCAANSSISIRPGMSTACSLLTHHSIPVGSSPNMILVLLNVICTFRSLFPSSNSIAQTERKTAGLLTLDLTFALTFSAMRHCIAYSPPLSFLFENSSEVHWVEVELKFFLFLFLLFSTEMINDPLCAFPCVFCFSIWNEDEID